MAEVDVTGGFAITYLLIASGVLAFFTWWLTLRYARPGTGPWVLLSTFFSWYLVFESFYVLLPVDLLHRLQGFYYGLWQFIYWVSFSLTWLVLPVQQYYEITGEFTRKDRFIASLKFNTKFYLAAGVLFVGLLIFIAVEGGLGWGDIVGVIVCIANTWGLFLAVVSLGYGLVEVPRHLWHNSNRLVRMRKLEYHAAQLDVDREECKDKVADAIRLVNQVGRQIKEDHDLRRYFDIVEENLPAERQVDASTARRLQDFEETSLHAEIKKGDITINTLARLNFYVKENTLALDLANAAWAELLDKVETLELLLQGESGEVPAGRSGILWGRIWKLRVMFGPIAGKVLSVLCAFCSLFLAWGEMVIYHTELSPFAALITSLNGGWGAMFFGTILLGYEAFCACYALFVLKILRLYAMHYNRRTDENSILFNAALLLRLIGPLGFNFLQLTKAEGTQFELILGQMDVVPFFGNTFTIYFPIFIGVFCFCTLFNVYSFVARMLGMKRFEYRPHSDETAEEGRNLIKREFRKRSGGAAQNMAARSVRATTAKKPTASRAAVHELDDRSDILLEDI